MASSWCMLTSAWIETVLSWFMLFLHVLLQVYYATLLVSKPFLLPVFVVLNFTAITLFAIMATLTRSVGDNVHFRNYTLSFVGGLHLLIAAAFVYFGIQVCVRSSFQIHFALSSQKNVCFYLYDVTLAFGLFFWRLTNECSTSSWVLLFRALIEIFLPGGGTICSSGEKI